jgi:hypothetical protein
MRAAAVTFLVALATMAGVARAADDATTLFHVTDTTFGCADPYATRVLTNPDQRPTAAAVKTTFTRGRCVSITPRSPWRFISRDDDVVLMEYAGDIGQPGSYYMRADQLVGPNGGHPGDLQPPTVGAVPPASGPAPAASASETALAPSPLPPAGMAPALTSATPDARPMWGVTEILLFIIALGMAVAGGYVLGRRSIRS